MTLTLRVIAMTVAVALLRGLAILKAPEAWFTDLRMAVLTPRPPDLHPRASLLTFTEDTQALLPHRSPVDRGFRAAVLDGMQRTGARGIALDILFDPPTEPDKDQALVEAIALFECPVVAGWVNERADLTDQRRTFLAAFIEASGAVAGLVLIEPEADDVVRTQRHAPAQGILRLPAALANAVGVAPPRRLLRMRWRGRPVNAAPPFQVARCTWCCR